MKIIETVERECCQPKDLKPYKGIFANIHDEKIAAPKFCIHCGQIFTLQPEYVSTTIEYHYKKLSLIAGFMEEIVKMVTKFQR